MPLDGPLPEQVDVLIIGSGFGGSVMAAELARAKRKGKDGTPLSICLVERGKAYPPGSFPRDPAGVSRNFWDPTAGLYGMFNVWGFKNVDAIVSSGLGGGSLIYANVMLPKDKNWFTQKTPDPSALEEEWMINRDDLDEHYEAVRDFLDVQTLPHDTDDETVPDEFRLPKTTRFLQNTIKANIAATEYAGLTVENIDRLGEFGGYAPLAVRFRESNGNPAIGAPLPTETYGNVHGAPYRTTCTMIGECDLGCNQGAKNSLDHTYLSEASFNGVSIHTLTEVVGMDHVPGRTDYRFDVHVHVHEPRTTSFAVEEADQPVAQYPPTPPPSDLPIDSDAPNATIRARRVVLAAGTLGTSLLLLRNQSRLGVQPAVSPGTLLLGSRFSGNGDFLAFVSHAFGNLEATRGPVITAYRRYPADTDTDDGDLNGGTGEYPQGMYIEDAGYPAFAAWLIQMVQSGAMGKEFLCEWAERWKGNNRDDNDTNLSAEINKILKDGEFSAKFMPLLGMGRDIPDGKLTFDFITKTFKCDWSVKSSKSYFETMKTRMCHIARGFGGHFVSNPLYDLFNRVITVHPVGGCPMDTSRHEGVVDTFGRMRGVPGLRVCDGSVFPGPIGPNPSLTIAAFARRSAQNLLEEQDFAATPGNADEWDPSR